MGLDLGPDGGIFQALDGVGFVVEAFWSGDDQLAAGFDHRPHEELLGGLARVAPVVEPVCGVVEIDPTPISGERHRGKLPVVTPEFAAGCDVVGDQAPVGAKPLGRRRRPPRPRGGAAGWRACS